MSYRLLIDQQQRCLDAWDVYEAVVPRDGTIADALRLVYWQRPLKIAIASAADWADLSHVWAADSRAPAFTDVWRVYARKSGKAHQIGPDHPTIEDIEAVIWEGFQ